MHITSNEIDDEEDDLPLSDNKLNNNKISDKNQSALSLSSSASSSSPIFKTDKKQSSVFISCGLKRKLSSSLSSSSLLNDNNISSNEEEIPKKKNFFIKLPSVSLKKLNCNQDRVVEENSKKINNSDQILNNNLEKLYSKINDNKNSENHTVTSDKLKNKTKIRKRKYQETVTENSSKNNDNNNNINNKINNNVAINDDNVFLNKEKQENLNSKQENNLKNITEYKTPVRKFFKSRKLNTSCITTVFSGGNNYSYHTTEPQQSSTTATEEKIQYQKFKTPLKTYFDKSISDENKEIIVKENKQNNKKNNNKNNNKNNIEKLNLNNIKKNSNLSLSSTDKLLVENKENCLLTFPLNENIKSATLSSSNETAVIENLNDNHLNDNFKTKSHNIPLSPTKLNNNNNNNDIIDLTATKVISDTRKQQQILHKNQKQKQQLINNEQNQQTKTSVFDLLKRNHLNFISTLQSSKKRKIIENSNSENSKKICSDMSVYDRRIQADDRPPVNGYSGGGSGNNLTTNRGIHHHHHHHHHHNNEDITTSLSSSNSTTTIMNNHYYQCPPPTPPQPTMATLCNIGNTCYLNSVIYTLRFAPMFLHNLHHLIDDLSYIQQNFIKYHSNIKSSSLGRNITGLHMENTRSWSSKDLASLENIQKSCDMPKSNQQIATEKLHELYQSLHRNECTETTEPFQADIFLHAIQDVSAIFEGNQQQDAHEFLMCVLDSIRETCQALIKAISECPDAIINGCISLPEQKESQCAVTTIPKEKSLQRESGSSAIIKTSFFSRKSKRKDAELQKNLKSNNSSNNRLQSPHKDNTHTNSQQFQTSSDTDNTLSGGGIGDTLNGSKNSLKSDLTTDLTKTNLKDNKERLSDKIKKLGLDFFSEDFEGVTVSTTKCLSCETITEQKETMIDIAVPITGYENIDLGEKFIQDSCVTKEYFRGENKYRCEQCMGYTEAIRSISYEVLPRLLVIQLSRFSGVMEKINTYLPTPFTLQCFCSKCLLNASSSSSSTTSTTTATTTSTLSTSCASAENKNQQHVYKLYSVITHVGATMSVGHYIAYTCSLDWANDYLNCPKDHRMRQAQIIKQQQQQQQAVNNITNTNNSILNGPAERNVRHIKKMIFGRSKASSSGDMSKTVKSINGLSSSSSNKSFNNSNSGATTTTINCGDKQQNTICPSINCCGLQLRNNYLLNNLNYNNSSSGGYYIDIDDNNPSSSSVYNSTVNYNNSNNSSSGYGTNNQQNSNNSNCVGGGNGNNSSGGGIGKFNRNPSHQNEPIWYMCDDDKIKAMSQREFEDMLSPNRKIMITPYLLFYARNDVQ